ncbi:hypothetical protein MTR67_049087 [Solanum verrucosum]|uniref:Reverse transcriptase domain-containing protein n=1 Tax=Solanum verrucosum TaxID=315347 RepID=A0AAF0UZQ8_SOLVR|nr:hypothetical protein MTR67_049087 [Solanum verrucosum]
MSTLSIEEKEELELPFTELEISSALMACAPDKAPGPDGYTMAFFQKSRCFIKDDILAAFNFFHQNCQMVRSSNASFIALIPKKKERMKKVVNSLVSGQQSAFLKNRQITDASLIANEVLDRRIKSGEYGILCKLDIEKAFDQLNWAYLVNILKQLGFGDRSYQVQKNNWALAMEGLSQFLARAKELQWIQGFQVGGNPATTVNVANLEELAGILGCKTGSLPTTYLGLPLGASFKSSGIWNGVIEKMEKRLATWKMQYLSMGGRLTLISNSQKEKWLWRYGQTEVGFWRDIIKAKYGIQDHWCPMKSTEPHGVGVWKHISSFQDNFFGEVSFKAGNGLEIRFWQDKWLGNSRLKDYFPSLFQIASDKEATIAQYRDNNYWTPYFQKELSRLGD